MLTAAIWLVAVVLLVIAFRKTRRSAGASVSAPPALARIYDMLNEDKRRAIEIIVEEKPKRGIPKTRTAIFPELEASTRPR